MITEGMTLGHSPLLNVFQNHLLPERDMDVILSVIPSPYLYSLSLSLKKHTHAHTKNQPHLIKAEVTPEVIPSQSQEGVHAC